MKLVISSANRRLGLPRFRAIDRLNPYFLLSLYYDGGMITEEVKVRIALDQGRGGGFDVLDVSPLGLYIIGQVSKSPS